jgi:hypothetical protein
MVERDLREALQHELDELARVRDELRLQIHLATADAKDEWTKLEQTFSRVSTALSHAAERAREPAEQAGSAARSLLDDLRRGYERLRAEIKM